MANKKLPIGFTSWLQLYDYLQKEKPESLPAKSIQFSSYNRNEEYHLLYKIRLSTIERNCWREIKQVRLSQNDTHYAISSIYNSTLTPEILKRIVTFLEKSQLNL